MGNGAVNELKRQLQEDDELYRRFVTSLEQEHGGEFVAIRWEGKLLFPGAM